jgi:hypothetical protein
VKRSYLYWFLAGICITLSAESLVTQSWWFVALFSAVALWFIWRAIEAHTGP